MHRRESGRRDRARAQRQPPSATRGFYGANRRGQSIQIVSGLRQGLVKYAELGASARERSALTRLVRSLAIGPPTGVLAWPHPAQLSWDGPYLMSMAPMFHGARQPFAVGSSPARLSRRWPSTRHRA